MVLHESTKNDPRRRRRQLSAHRKRASLEETSRASEGTELLSTSTNGQRINTTSQRCRVQHCLAFVTLWLSVVLLVNFSTHMKSTTDSDHLSVQAAADTAIEKSRRVLLRYPQLVSGPEDAGNSKDLPTDPLHLLPESEKWATADSEDFKDSMIHDLPKLQEVVTESSPTTSDMTANKKETESKEEPLCPAGPRIPAANSTSLYDMFERLATDPAFAQYAPKVVSRPKSRTEDTAPWVLVFDNFLTDQEVKSAIKELTTGKRRFYNSVVAGGRQSSGYRTSESIDCQDSCLTEPWIQPVVSKIQKTTGVNYNHAEDLTLTHYGVGGKYGKHHDYIIEERNPKGWRNCGNRILTFLVYLNDVAQGGNTSFFHLDLDVAPKQGRALIFPNVFLDRVKEKDERTAHEAKVVEEGEKYIAQTWFDLYDQVANRVHGCC